MQSNPLIFDRKRVLAHRNRAAANFASHGFLLREMAVRLSERLDDIKQGFPVALANSPFPVTVEEALKGRGGIETLVQSSFLSRTTIHEPRTTIFADEELLPFAENSFDAVFSLGSLHLVNDLVGALIQMRRALKPGGLFIAILPGAQTLNELRASFEAAELLQKGGISPRVAPFIEVRDGGSLLQRAGFAEPVADSDMLTVEYTHPLKLLHDLKGMGEANALSQSIKHFTPCSLVMQMADHYLRHFSTLEGRVRASFELITLTGWKS